MPAGKPCDALGSTTSIGRLLKQARSVGGPVAQRVRRKLLMRVTPRTAHVERGIRAPLSEDGPAIQNDVAAAHVTVSPVPSLEPLGIFVHAFEILPDTTSSSPQSPRGPPVQA